LKYILYTILLSYVLQAKASDAPDKEFRSLKDYLSFADNNKSKPNPIDVVRDKDIIIKNKLGDFENISVSNHPKVKRMLNQDSIYMHKGFPLIILLPDNTKIVSRPYIHPINQAVIKNAQFNRIDILPNGNFFKATLVITYFDLKQKQPKIFLINLNLIDDSKKSILYNIVKYEREEILSYENVIEKYLTKFNKYPDNNSMIKIGLNTYKFVVDNINGNITIDGVKNKFIMLINEEM